MQTWKYNSQKWPSGCNTTEAKFLTSALHTEFQLVQGVSTHLVDGDRVEGLDSGVGEDRRRELRRTFSATSRRETWHMFGARKLHQ